MNTSDLSGNDSSDGSGKSIYRINKFRLFFFFVESPNQIGDDIFDEPYRMRSSECKIESINENTKFFFSKYHHVENYTILVS
jgi:hypothetical protein